MKRLFTTMALIVATLATMAQGWPENYGGVMLQGFYWDSYKDSRWAKLETEAPYLAGTFDLVWIPQSGKGAYNPSMGYDPLYWFEDYYSSFGSKEQLLSLIKTFKDNGIGTIGDVVINHRGNLSTWNDFPSETYNGETYALTYKDICSDDEAASKGYDVGPNKDTGENWDGMRDLDHKSENVQRCVKAYLKMLLDEFGYAGFRYDMVKGYAAEYTKMYNEDSKPTFSVGECWDGTPTIRRWIDGTGKTSAAFDFQFRYTVRNAINSQDWTKLAAQNEGNWPLVSGNYYNGSYRQYAVTFVENHDTEYRSATAQQDPIRKDTLAANAYLLAMPGTPCVFLKHWQAYKQEIANMVAVRKAVGITNVSQPVTIGSIKDYYAVQVEGTNGKKLLCVVGTKAGSYTPTNTNWKKVLSGYHYAYYVQGIDPADISFPELKEDQKPQDGVYNGVPSFCSVSEGEICAFFEAPVTWGSQIFTWAWMTGKDGKEYLGTGWPGVSATLLGTADNGNKVFKWVSAQTTAPNNIIFSGGGNQTNDLVFTNGGYYTKDGQQDVVTTTGIQEVRRQMSDGSYKIYDLQGRRISQMPSSGRPQKGLYIVNGRKIIII